MTTTAPLFRLLDVQKAYTVASRGGLLLSRMPKQLKALDGVRMSLKAGESLAIVGESGSGRRRYCACCLALRNRPTGVPFSVRRTLLRSTVRIAINSAAKSR